jgi:hypothetical protein
VSLETFLFHGLNFSVGGNQAADGTALNGGNVDDQGRATRENGDEDSGGDDSGGKPGVAAAARGMPIRIVVVRRQILFREWFPLKCPRQPVFANLFSFRAVREQLQVTIYHRSGSVKKRGRLWRQY